MIVAESLCCGTPIVGFQAGGPELIAIKEYSDFVEYGDVYNLYKLINENFNKGKNKLSISENSITKYNKNNMYYQYKLIYDKK